MSDLFKARQEAYSLATQKYNPGNNNHREYDSIYLAATSNVKDTLSLYNNYESVLALGATGAHGFEAALHGAKRVDMFDINELQRIFFEFFKTAIMVLDYEEFVHFFSLEKQTFMFKKKDIANLLGNDLFERLVYYLPEDVSFVLETIFEMFYSPDIIMSALFRFEYNVSIGYLKKYISLYNKEDYNRLKEILLTGECQFRYHQLSIEDVPKFFKDKYDLIILDNLFQYYSKLRTLDTPYKINMFIRKELSNLLTDTGVIQAAYGFEIASDSLKSMLNIPYTPYRSIFTPMVTKEEIKNGIVPNLIKKWPDNYSYDFIPGVEREEGRDTDNVVLTYRRK